MALSMEEQRLLVAIETRLNEEDPKLARRLANLGKSQRRRRIRLIAALAVVAIVVLTAFAAAVITAIS